MAVACLPGTANKLSAPNVTEAGLPPLGRRELN